MSVNLANLQTQCIHDLVLEFDDHKPHKIGRIIKCYCPACGRISENIYYGHEVDKSIFKNSKLIDLTKLPMNIFSDSFSFVLEYIFNNYDKYYSNDIDEKEIAESIIDLVEKEKNKDNSKVLKKKKMAKLAIFLIKSIKKILINFF